jgi:hypothetical protein
MEGGAQITGISRADLLRQCSYATARLELKDRAHDLRDRMSNTKREHSAEVDWRNDGYRESRESRHSGGEGLFFEWKRAVENGAH